MQRENLNQNSKRKSQEAWLDTTFSVFCPNMNTVPFSAILMQGARKMEKSSSAVD